MTGEQTVTEQVRQERFEVEETASQDVEPGSAGLAGSVRPGGSGRLPGVTVLHVEGESLSALTATLRVAAGELEAAEAAVPGYVGRILDGAGEFAEALQEGLLAFQLSWCAALRTFATSLEAVGGLAEQTAATMAASDADLAGASGPR